MTEAEKDLLRNIPLMRMEAKSTLHQITYLLNNTGYNLEEEINKILDRLKWLDEIEEGLKKKQESENEKK
jgi:hypothetical protein